MTEKQRIEKEVGIAPGDTWEHVISQTLLWLEKKFAEQSKPRPRAQCDTCGLVHDASWIEYRCSNHPRCRGEVKSC